MNAWNTAVADLCGCVNAKKGPNGELPTDIITSYPEARQIAKCCDKTHLASHSYIAVNAGDDPCFGDRVATAERQPWWRHPWLAGRGGCVFKICCPTFLKSNTVQKQLVVNPAERRCYGMFIAAIKFYQCCLGSLPLEDIPFDSAQHILDFLDDYCCCNHSGKELKQSV
jgi:hypothetical protein